MLNICLTLAASLGAEGVGVGIAMAGELTRTGRTDAAAQVRDAMLRVLDRLGQAPDKAWAVNGFARAMNGDWQPYKLTTDLLEDGPYLAGDIADRVRSLSEIERRLAGEGYQDQIYPLGHVAELTLHLARCRLDAGEPEAAFTFAAVAAGLMVREWPGVYTGDSYEVPEALGVLLARIAVSK